MSFKRELAKALLREVVSDRATRAATSLRGSARREAAGLAKDSFKFLAEVSDEVAENPNPIVELIEAWWDAPRREQRRPGVNW